jgi:hypothetical protein
MKEQCCIKPDKYTKSLQLLYVHGRITIPQSDNLDHSASTSVQL